MCKSMKRLNTIIITQNSKHWFYMLTSLKNKNVIKINHIIPTFICLIETRLLGPDLTGRFNLFNREPDNSLDWSLAINQYPNESVNNRSRLGWTTSYHGWTGYLDQFKTFPSIFFFLVPLNNYNVLWSSFKTLTLCLL